MLGRDVAYITLLARAVAALAAVFEEQLGLKQTNLDDGTGGKVVTFSGGRSAIAIFSIGHPYVGAAAKQGAKFARGPHRFRQSGRNGGHPCPL